MLAGIVDDHSHSSSRLVHRGDFDIVVIEPFAIAAEKHEFAAAMLADFLGVETARQLSREPD